MIKSLKIQKFQNKSWVHNTFGHSKAIRTQRMKKAFSSSASQTSKAVSKKATTTKLKYCYYKTRIPGPNLSLINLSFLEALEAGQLHTTTPKTAINQRSWKSLIRTEGRTALYLMSSIDRMNLPTNVTYSNLGRCSRSLFLMPKPFLELFGLFCCVAFLWYGSGTSCRWRPHSVLVFILGIVGGSGKGRQVLLFFFGGCGVGLLFAAAEVGRRLG